MRQPLVLAFVAFTSLGLAACATPNPIQTDRTVFNFDSTFQRAAYSQPIETTFDKTVTVFREAGYALDIIDRATGQITHGYIPPGSVVVSGSLPSADGSHSLYCAVIVKRVDAQTRSKVSINELLRDD